MTSECPDCGAVMQVVTKPHGGEYQRCPWVTKRKWRLHGSSVVGCGQPYQRDVSERAEWRRFR